MQPCPDINSSTILQVLRTHAGNGSTLQDTMHQSDNMEWITYLTFVHMTCYQSRKQPGAHQLRMAKEVVLNGMRCAGKWHKNTDTDGTPKTIKVTTSTVEMLATVLVMFSNNNHGSYSPIKPVLPSCFERFCYTFNYIFFYKNKAWNKSYMVKQYNKHYCL